jgi:hypothetical protein
VQIGRSRRHKHIEILTNSTAQEHLPSMSGRPGRGRGNRNGRDSNGRSAGRGRGRGRGTSYSVPGVTKPKGLCGALGVHVFDYGQKGAADQMRITWEKIVHHAGTIYGHDISNELQNKKTVVILEPSYTQEVLNKHAEREARRQTQNLRLGLARQVQKTALEQEVIDAIDPEAPMKLAILDNQIEEAAYEMGIELPIKLNELESTVNHNEWRTYRERTTRLDKQRGQAFSMIRGQCMQVLLDKMKHDSDWIPASESYDPLTLMRLIEKTILAQTEDQYPFATVYEQECTLYSFNQNTLSNEQWYERFNTRIDVGTAIGVTRQHKVLLDHVAHETIHGSTFEKHANGINQTVAEQAAIREKAEERYLSYVFLRQSGKQHNKLKVDLQNDFTTGDDRYPKNRQATLHLLDKYSKSVVAQAPISEGTAFAQRATRVDKQDTYDKSYWKDKECFNCHSKGHPSSHCPNKDKDSDDKSLSSKSSKTSKSSKSTAKSITKTQKRLKKSFATLSSKIDELENEDSDISASDSGDENSHFQTGSIEGYQMMQTETPQQQSFEQRNVDVLFKKTREAKIHLNLRNIILLDSQSTMDLFCNPELVQKVSKSKKTMTLKSNGGTMTIDHRAKISGYDEQVWFSKDAITNIIALSNLIKQYRVTYDSADEMFIVHREPAGKPNMEFKMHSSGLHYHDPSDADLNFNINTVSENMSQYTKRQVQGAQRARTLYTTLGYPSIKDFKWVIQSNQIKDCPVTVEDVVNAHAIWGKNIAALKGKTTRKQP